MDCELMEESVSSSSSSIKSSTKSLTSNIDKIREDKEGVAAPSALSVPPNVENVNVCSSTLSIDAVKNRFQSIQERKEKERNDILHECLTDLRKNIKATKQEPVVHLLPKINPQQKVRSASASTTTTMGNNDATTNNIEVMKYEKIIRGSKKVISIKQAVIVQSSNSNKALPASTANTFIKSSFPVEDDEDLKFVPYFGDDDREDIVSGLYDIAKREKTFLVGAEYREKEMGDVIEECRSLLKGYEEQKTLGLLLKVHVGFIQDYLRKKKNNNKNKNAGDDDTDNATSSMVVEKRKADNEITYETLLESYQELFCRRCLTYDCYKHGNLKKPDMKLQLALALQKEKEQRVLHSNNGNNITASIPDPPPFENSYEAESTVVQTTLTLEQKAIIPALYQIFNGNLNIISNHLEVPKSLLPPSESVEPYITHETIPPQPKRKKQNGQFTSMGNYNQSWLKRIEETSVKPLFYPCTHSEPCSETTCPCVQHAHFCTKHCVYSTQSRNFFRGCACKGGQCRTKSCPCYAAKRECDVDLCKSCQCGPNKFCKNDSITTRSHARLLLAPSTVAGWGIFNKSSVKKGDFIQEYVGEAMSQEDAERRGRVYDKVNKSFLFNLCTDCVIDANWKGNKTRFINHSKKPNVDSKVVFVNGDLRIGLYAKEDIESQSELFFDYKYDQTIELLSFTKPSTVVEWMKNPDMAGKISLKQS